MAAIIAADIVGYSRLMAADEEGTLARVQQLRDQVTEQTIREFGGRIVKRTGDGTLLEFTSVIDAARAAVSVQRRLDTAQTDIPEEQRIVLRIGINLGDILIEGDDIYGDGVNIAARLEQLCSPGEIVISGAAYDQLEGRSEFVCRYLGEQRLKNIPRPVRTYRISPLEDCETAGAEVAGPGPEPPMANDLPDKPSIVVLPFTNMSSDPDQEYFCDGISEDLTTALSRFHGLFVIARNTAFTFKQQAQNVREISRALGVQYVLEGSVRRLGNRIRVTAQLVDAINDRHVWAEKYDCNGEDLFSVQDEIVSQIVGSVAPEIDADAVAKAQRKKNIGLAAWEQLARGRRHLGQYTAEDNLIAEAIFSDVIKKSPSNAEAQGFLGWAYGIDALYSWNRPQPESLQLGLQAAQAAVELDNRNGLAHAVLGAIYVPMRQHADAIEALETAVSINPNLSVAIGFLGIVRVYTHDYEQAEKGLNQAIRLSPRDPMLAMFLANLGQARFNAGDYEGAITGYRKAMRANSRLPSPYRGLAASYGMRGDLKAARNIYAKLAKILPDVTISDTRRAIGFAFEDDEERFVEGLRRAGMPE